MKKIFTFRNTIYSILIITGLAGLQSCVVYQPYAQQMVTVPDIVKMSNDGVASKDIIKEIRKTHTVYSLKADQLLKLREEGVQDSVLNYMNDTKVKAARQDQRYADSYYWWTAPDGFLYGGYGWGWPYGYFGWGFGPTIIYHADRDFHGENHYHGGGYHRGGVSHEGLRR